MEIRSLDTSLLTKKHYEQIFNLASSWWNEISPIKTDRDSVYNLIEYLAPFSLAYVDENDDIVGYAAILVNYHPFNREYLVGNLLSIVIDDKYRHSRLFKRIMKDIDNKAKELNISEIVSSFFSNIKESSLNRLGYSKTSISYVKRY